MSSSNSRLKKPMRPLKGQIIPCQPIYGGEPLMCSVNVEKRIKALGGKKVFGWKLMRDRAPGMICKENHCVWESPEGKLFCVTPVFAGVNGEEAIAEFPESIEFERDDNASFTEKASPNRWVCTVRNKHIEKAAEYMTLADGCMINDLEQCRQWTEKANKEMRKWNPRCKGWDTPNSLEMSDVLKTVMNRGTHE